MPNLRVARTVAAVLVVAALIVHPAAAVTVFLDHNTDDNPYTFENLVVGPVSVPVDVIVYIGPQDTNLTFLSVLIQWGYGGGGEGGYDVYGSTDAGYFEPLPDSPPFTGIIPYTCLCFGRCFCDAMVNIDATVAAPVAPGPYLLARLEFSRQGFSRECTYPIWPIAEFQAFCQVAGCDNPIGDPRTTMVIRDVATTVGDAVEERTWGRVKGIYR